MAPLIAVTDHAVERCRQRVRGSLDARTEIAARVGKAWAAGAVSREPPPGAAARAAPSDVRDGRLVFVCRRTARAASRRSRPAGGGGGSRRAAPVPRR